MTDVQVKPHTIFVPHNASIKNVTRGTWAFVNSARRIPFGAVDCFNVASAYGQVDVYEFTDLDGDRYFVLRRDCMLFTEEGVRIGG